MSSKEPNIVRAPRSNYPYFMLATATAQDRNLSWEARGMLCYILSKPDSWCVKASDLQQNCSRGKVYKILSELIAAGYIEDRKRTKDDQGKFIWTDYIVHERPILAVAEKPCDENHNMENHNMETMSWKPSHIDNIEVVSIEEITTPPTTPQPSVVSEPKAPVTKSDELLPVVDKKMSAEEYKAYVAVINQDFKLYKGRDMKLFHQLRGTSKQKGIKEYAFTDKPVDLAELKGFVAWYRRTYPNISLPQAPDKIASRVEEFRQSVQKRNPVSPMQPVAPYSDIPELSDEDMQNIEAMIEAARKKSRGQAA